MSCQKVEFCCCLFFAMHHVSEMVQERRHDGKGRREEVFFSEAPYRYWLHIMMKKSVAMEKMIMPFGVFYTLPVRLVTN